MRSDPIRQPSGDAAAVGRAEIPAAPVVMPDDIWFDTPNVVVNQGRYTIGWQRWPTKKGGPSFVTVRRTALDGLKVVERYPLTAEGWTQAWHALVRLDSAAAATALPALARRQADRAEADSGFAERMALDARSLSYLPQVIFIGGYLAGGELVAGQMYELRFLEDRLSVFPHGSLEAQAEFGYADVQAVEVAGPGRVRKWSPRHEAMLAAAFGVTGALMAYGSTLIKTFVQIQTTDSELFFLHTALTPDDLRIHLSPGIGAVRQTRASATSPADTDREPGSASPVDELSRLAGLLDSGLLTREEFDQLKARLLGGH